MRIIFALFAFFAIATSSAHAEVIFDANVFYYSDTFTLATATSSKRTMYDFSVGMNLTKKGQLVLGWNYASSSFADDDGTTQTTLSVTDMGPKLAYYLDKELVWCIGVSYNLITKGSYSTGGGSAIEYRGSSIKADLGYLPQISESFYLGLKLNYYKPSLKEEITGQTALAQVSYGRAVIYPSIAISARF